MGDLDVPPVAQAQPSTGLSDRDNEPPKWPWEARSQNQKLGTTKYPVKEWSIWCPSDDPLHKRCRACGTTKRETAYGASVCPQCHPLAADLLGQNEP